MLTSRPANSSRRAREILGDVVEDLRAIVRRRAGPARSRRPRRLDGVADVLAVALADLADLLAVRTVDRAAVARVGARLLAADEELRRAVDPRPREEIAGILAIVTTV